MNLIPKSWNMYILSNTTYVTNLPIIELPRAANKTECKQLGSKVSLYQILAVLTG